MIYRAKLTGTFEVTQDCRADSEEEARKIFETKMTSTKASPGDPFDVKCCPAAYD